MDTSSGWERQSVEAAISKHVTYWFQARLNQGKVLGNVPNFYTIFKDFSAQPEQMVEQMREKFKAYLEEQFEDVFVDTGRQNITGETNNYRLTLSARIVVDGVKYDIAQTILVTGELYKVLVTERLNK